MKFCSSCGSPVSIRRQVNDSFLRLTCVSCHQVFYQNPIVVAGCVPYWRGKVLLCRRAIEPGYGCWTVPGGYVESGETVETCAKREAMEEASIDVNIGSLLSVTNVIAANQVHVFFQADMQTGNFSAGCESLEVKLFHPSDVPWHEIAFQSVEDTLRQSLDRFGSRGCKEFAISQNSIRPPKRQPLAIVMS